MKKHPVFNCFRFGSVLILLISVVCCFESYSQEQKNISPYTKSESNLRNKAYQEPSEKETRKQLFLPPVIIDVNGAINEAEKSVPYDRNVYIFYPMSKDVGAFTAYLYDTRVAQYVLKIDAVDIKEKKNEKGEKVGYLIPVGLLKSNRGYRLNLALDEPIDIYFTTISDDFKKRAKSTISPDFGVTAVFFNDGEQSLVKPSLNFVVNFFPFPQNKDVPVNFYKLYSPYRFSLQMGLTLNSLAIDRVSSDLVGSNNLILGIAYQLNDKIKWSNGAVLLYEHNKQYISHDLKTLQFVYQTSITIDLDIKDLFGGIAGTLGFK
ncbi:hypothetical protein MATR_31830 [Marivirga tractuosa]|uniref:Uncharacterized protein n=1 Tax=Marivirga tractuosa (strain ATCC 23168 / DSM 4126 / NBRC 15989 / NCIMB 1408 / VKM B-1430 / H-43) TaxID=643867 RepID=E4TTG5_MARTH|nr:hypothetical protein [Marivirga tractuosa]ADR22968.1 hypothetical protein Ftrac_2992 [Marivirga tractuosa DSM 4126]BDD16358.1 hypothetical protein MATR_31830 [Marivirga tractuosa]